MRDCDLYSGTFARCLPCRCDHLSTTSYWYWLLTRFLCLLVECKRVVGRQQVELFNLCHIYRQWETDSGQYLYQCTVVTRWQVSTSGKCLSYIPVVATSLFTVLFSWLGWWGAFSWNRPWQRLKFGPVLIYSCSFSGSKGPVEVRQTFYGTCFLYWSETLLGRTVKGRNTFLWKMQHLRNYLRFSR